MKTDTQLTEDVLAALASCVLLPPGAVTPTVEAGCLRLDGAVDWDYQRKAAESAVRSLPGLAGLSNQLQVTCRVGVEEIEDGIRAALARQAEREARHVQVSVDGACVVLRGQVHSLAERAAVAGAAWSSPGVMAVINEVTVQA